ncbi:MAG: hypothetical protein IPF92_08115 [Myxococcales bacterium]|nr:hypothetical protein [Myxococcales bacterium]MBL0193297.1 hypothetical protein [Myxococcales bacterium]
MTDARDDDAEPAPASAAVPGPAAPEDPPGQGEVLASSSEAAPQETGLQGAAPPEAALPEAAPPGAASVPPAATLGARVARWAFLAVPLVGALELGAHLVQTHSVAPDADWQAARVVVQAKLRPEDLLLFAPKWEDPVGRAQFGDALATLARTARPDETRFPRAVEVSARGARRPELAAWKVLEEQAVGRLVVRTYENPHPVKVLDDLVLRVSPSKMAVSRVDGEVETPCPFTAGRVQAGGLGAGPAIPGDRFQCVGSFVGVSILHALDHDPKVCLFAPPLGGAAVLRVRFRGVRFGAALHGHHGLQNEAERDKLGVPVSLDLRTELGLVGRAEHKDGMGWTGFEFGTPELAGKTTDLIADIRAANANRRHYCFEADTREVIP